jgi:hypothetical protein
MLGLDALRSASNEQGVPVPWFCGCARVGVTYISRMFNIERTKVRASKGGAVSAYKYRAAFAALVGFGPIDRLFHVITNDDLLWSEDPMSPTERPGAGTDYVDVTIEQLGTLRVYWGTETQNQDTGLVYEGITHPAYRGFSYVRSLSWNLGEFSGGDVPAPNLELMVGRYPMPSWWDLPSVKIGRDINAAAAIWDLLLQVRKNGIKSSLINTDSLIDVAARLDNEGLGISPILIANKSIRESLVEILQHVDGYYREGRDGRLEFGLNRPTTGSLPSFSPIDMTQRPAISTGSWTQTAAGAQVRFKNGDLYQNDDVASAFDPANYAVTGIPDAPSVDRPFITNPDTAQQIANAMAQRNGIPAGSGTLSLRRSRIGTLQPGDRFTFDCPQLGFTDLPAIATAIEFPEPGKPEVVVEWVADNTQTMAGHYVAPAYVAPPSALKTPVASPMVFGWVLDGAGAPDAVSTWFGLAAVAPNLLHNGFYVWREFPDTSGDYVDTGPEYAAWTPELYIVGTAVAIGDTVMEVYLGPEALLTGMLGVGDTGFGSFPTIDIDAGKVFLALDAGGFGGPVEVVQVTALTPGSGPGQYAATIVRAQWGTTDVAHDGWDTVGVNSSVAMISTDDLAKIPVAAPFATESFLVQPAIAGRRCDIATVTPFDITP